MLSPGPGGEESEEGQVRGLRGPQPFVFQSCFLCRWGHGLRHRFYFKADGRAFAQGLPGLSPRWFSCPSRLFRQGQRAGSVDLGGLKSFIAIQGPWSWGVFVQTVEVFPFGRISRVTRGTACFFLAVPHGRSVCGPECVVGVRWWVGAWLCPALSRGPTGHVSCLGKTSISLVLQLNSPLIYFEPLSVISWLSSFQWLHSCEPLCEM